MIYSYFCIQELLLVGLGLLEIEPRAISCKANALLNCTMLWVPLVTVSSFDFGGDSDVLRTLVASRDHMERQGSNSGWLLYKSNTLPSTVSGTCLHILVKGAHHPNSDTSNHPVSPAVTPPWSPKAAALSFSEEPVVIGK